MKRYKPLLEDITNNQIKTIEFKRWFKKSKVVDHSGNPLVVYHGSNSSFEIFDLKKIGSHTDLGIWGKGFYFSDHLTAKHYGDDIKGVFLSLQNPYMIRENTSIQEVANYLEMDESTLQEVRGFVRPYTSFVSVFTSQIKDKKHDGIIVLRNGNSIEYIAFYPNQIKSATDNNGSFNLHSHNIYEDITIKLNKNDTFLYGKFKNKKAIFDHIEKDDKGQDIIVTDTGLKIPLLHIRLIKN